MGKRGSIKAEGEERQGEALHPRAVSKTFVSTQTSPLRAPGGGTASPMEAEDLLSKRTRQVLNLPPHGGWSCHAPMRNIQPKNLRTLKTEREQAPFRREKKGRKTNPKQEATHSTSPSHRTSMFAPLK